MVAEGSRRPAFCHSVPTYILDPLHGDPDATYTPIDWRTTPNHRPELSAAFVADVSGAAAGDVNDPHAMRWEAPAGTPCLILGHWSDGSVHVKWRAFRDYYWLDGRVPAWVVEPRVGARDVHVLHSNVRRRKTRREGAGCLPGGLTIIVGALGLVWLSTQARGALVVIAG
jgi:hypothetical protein